MSSVSLEGHSFPALQNLWLSSCLPTLPIFPDSLSENMGLLLGIALPLNLSILSPVESFVRLIGWFGFDFLFYVLGWGCEMASA